MTEKLFYEDSHLSEFSARVVSCEPSKHGFEVVLDRTAFYPEGGGQPGDTGFLSGVRVTDTHEREGEVVHYCEAPLAVGAAVEGKLDYARRFEFMQLHSGEHILSGLIHQRFGYQNVGFHMGADFVTIDFDGMLSEQELSELEAAANEVVWQNVPVQVDYPDAEALKTIPYRSKKALSGWVRIVTIPGADICACCGTHVQSTGEIGLIKVFSCVKFHEGVRLEILCGRRAYQYLCAVNEQNSRVSALFSAKPRETAAAAARVADELVALKFRAGKLEEQLFEKQAKDYAGAGDVLLFTEGLSPDGVRKLTAAIMEVCGGRAAVFSGSDRAGYAYALGKENGDLRALVAAMNKALNGRGGGKPFFAQGSVKATGAEIEAFFREAEA